MTVLEENRSSQIYAVKAFAMLSVICAHMKLQLEYGMAGWLPDRIISIYSIVGVPIFFICSGYYYHREEGDTGEFWKKKTKNIIVPWIIWSALTNILNNLITRRTVSMKGFVGWFSGYSSLYYFLAVLCFCFVIFKICSAKCIKVICTLSLMANIAVILEMGGVFRCNLLETYWVNYLVWPFFFGLGVLWQWNGERIDNFIGRSRAAILVISIATVIVSCAWFIISDRRASYWSYCSLFFELAVFFILCFLCKKGHVFNNKLTVYIGENTMFIYLVHMQIVGVINTRLPQNGFFYLIKPLIGLVVMMILLEITKRLLVFFHMERIAPYLGVKV